MMEFETICALVDGELEGQEQAEAIDRIGKSAPAKAQYEAALLLKQVLRDKCEPYECGDVWKSCRSRLDRIDKAQRAERFVGRYAWGICGAFLLLIVGAGTLNRFAGSHTLYAGDVSAMVGSMSPVEATGNRIRDWMSRHTGGNVVAIPEDRAIQVESAASCVLNDRSLLRLVLSDSEGRMLLIVISNTDEIAGISGGIGRTLRRGQINNLNAVTWTQNGNAFLLMGERDHDQLVAAASHIRIE